MNAPTVRNYKLQETKTVRTGKRKKSITMARNFNISSLFKRRDKEEINSSINNLTELTFIKYINKGRIFIVLLAHGTFTKKSYFESHKKSYT